MGNSSSIAEPYLRERADAALRVAYVEQPHLVDTKSFRRVAVPGDNSCLFTSVAGIMGAMDAVALRQIVRNEIANMPTHYSSDILGMPRKEYMNWITKPTSWGGYIELAILANYFKVRLVAIDVQSLREHHFPDPAEAEQVRLLSSGDRGAQVQVAAIPRTEVKRDGGRSFVLYHIQLRSESRGWSVARRYREFHALDTQLRARYPNFGAKLPPKALITNLDAAFVEERRRGLEQYLSRLLSAAYPVATPEFRAFMHGCHVPASLEGSTSTPQQQFFQHTGFLLHDGVHYDFVVGSSLVNNRPLTLFPSQPEFTQAAVGVAHELRGRRQFSDLREGVLECQDCGAVVKGQNGAATHAEQTGHVRFEERFRL